MTTKTLDTTERREAFEAAIVGSNVERAAKAASELLAHENTIRNWKFIASASKEIRSGANRLTQVKVALLASFSIEFVHDVLISCAFAEGIKIEIYQAGFNQHQQEILDPQSGLYSYEPDVVVLAIEGQHWAPNIYNDYSEKTDDDLESEVRRVEGEIRTMIKKVRGQTNVPILIHNLSRPLYPDMGIHDGGSRVSQIDLVNRINEGIHRISREATSVHVVDYAGIVFRVGAENWYDRRMEHFARAPISQAKIGLLACEYLKFIRALSGKNKKCLVLDLDNTIWGGVVGEDGRDGIKLGPNYPGSAYLAFQKEILKLHNQGVILAIASKNNESDVDDVFANHECMILKKEHFSSVRVNWNPKSQSIAEIASELNIGLDHIVFVDDNAVECSLINEALPTVTTIHLSTRPEEYVQAIRRDGLFDNLNITSEDRERGQLYKQRDESEKLKATCDDLEQFYQSLNMKLEIRPVDEHSLARAAQLTQKTNQFNATTIRTSEAEIHSRCGAPNWILRTVRVKDRFGDNGIVGLAIANIRKNSLDIHTFLLSCRVIGRSVETALLSELYDQARNHDLEYLTGRIVSTPKNLPVRDLFERHGFKIDSSNGEGETIWRLALASGQIQIPKWFEIVSDRNSG